jgi:hypothetical protein
MSASDWQDFAEVAGSASGALTGLLFVSVSLNASRIAGHAGLRASAGQTLVLVMTPLIIATALLAPRQPDAVLGAELMLIGLVAGWILIGFRRIERGLADEDLRLISIFNRPTLNVSTMLLVITGGAILAAGQRAGLYLMFPAIVASFTGGVLNAWYFLLPPPIHHPPAKPATDPPTEEPAH